MATAMPMIRTRTIPARELHTPRLGMRSDLGGVAMRRLRRVALSLLDMRTEFEVVAPGEDLDPGNSGLPTVVRPSIMGRVRRVASRLLDPWTGFVVLD